MKNLDNAEMKPMMMMASRAAAPLNAINASPTDMKNTNLKEVNNSEDDDEINQDFMTGIDENSRLYSHKSEIHSSIGRLDKTQTIFFASGVELSQLSNFTF